jgi:hypothetical protein
VVHVVAIIAMPGGPVALPGLPTNEHAP